MKPIIALMLIIGLIPSFTQASSSNASSEKQNKQQRMKAPKHVDVLADVFKYDEQSKRSIKLSELNQGCPKLDCIPSIDKPSFDNIQNIDFIHDDDVMMLVKYNGVQKAYSRKIMQSHEIVNDFYGEKPLVMTYCPLCGTSVAFVPLVDGQRTEFGVSGLLHNSDLVMYDRKTRSLWGQITGRSIVGPKTGERLKTVSAIVMSWTQLKFRYPNAQILLPPVKDKDRYSRFVYQNYTESDRLMFPVSLTDARLAVKQFVYGIEIDDTFIAFEENNLIAQTPMVESYGKRILQVTYEQGEVKAMDKKTGESFKVLRLYWFAWYAFHPTTQLRN